VEAADEEGDLRFEEGDDSNLRTFSMGVRD
jgi:hypothetical protein